MSSAAVASAANPSFRPCSAGLRGRLREATQAQHERLDRQLGALDLQSMGGYRLFLEANAAALLPLEAALERSGVSNIFPDWAERSRRAAILSDLTAAGGTVQPLPRASLLDVGGVLGTMYVLEGSRLGARYLLKSVAQSADPSVAAATAYLSHGAGQHLWQSFLARLDELALAARDEAHAIAGARNAFALFAQATDIALAHAKAGA
jgi:heme oxygenase